MGIISTEELLGTGNRTISTEELFSSPAPESGIKEFGKGVVRGMMSLVPSADVSKRIVNFANPAFSPVANNIIDRTTGAIAPSMEKTRNIVNQPARSFGGQVAGGLGEIAPNLIPMSRGIRAIERLPGVSAIAGKALIPSAVRSAIGFGGYEAGKAALTGKDAYQAGLEGVKSGAVFGAAGNLASKVIPSFAPFADRIRSAVGGATAGAVLAPGDQRVSSATQLALLGGVMPSAGGRSLFEKKIVNPADLNTYIGEKFNIIARPIVKRNIGQVERYNDRAINAVRDIASNPDKLGLTDAYGDPESRLPANLQETLISVYNLKKVLYDRYSQIPVIAGESGLMIDTGKVAKNLLREFSQEKYKLMPELKEKAIQEAQVLMDAKEMTPTAVEEHLASMNKNLTGYFARGIYNSGRSADVDAASSRILRAELDSTIENAQGGQYKELKRRYGDLKTIESDLVRRVGVDARKSVKGFFDLANIFSDGQIVHGLLTLNPATIATGIGTKTISNFYKNLNNPNQQIRNLFKVVERSIGNDRFNKVRKAMPDPEPILTGEVLPAQTRSVIPRRQDIVDAEIVQRALPAPRETMPNAPSLVAKTYEKDYINTVSRARAIASTLEPMRMREKNLPSPGLSNEIAATEREVTNLLSEADAMKKVFDESQRIKSAKELAMSRTLIPRQVKGR